MREYRKRKRGLRTSAAVSLRTPLPVPRAPEPSNIPRRIIETPGLQPAPANTGFVRKSARSSFKTALQLARTFPFGVRIATTLAKVRPAHGAATVEVLRDESGGVVSVIPLLR